MGRSHLAFALVAILLGAGCAQTVRPDEMSAQRHRQEAELQNEAAGSHIRAFDPSASTATPGGDIDVTGRAVSGPIGNYNPTEWHLKEAARISEHARQHEAAAAKLEAFEDAECREFSPRARATCPLFGPIRSVENTDDGVRLRLDAGAPLQALVAHIRCHLAYARVRGFEVASCPLMLRGVEARVTPDGAAILLESRDRKVVRELQRRATELEQVIRQL